MNKFLIAADLADYSEGYDYIDQMGSVFGAAAGAFMFGALIMLAIAVAAYVTYSLGLYKLAKAKGVNSAFLAWIPIGNGYLLGKTADNNNFAIALAVLPIANILLSRIGIGILPNLCSFAAFVLMIMCTYKIFKETVPENAVLYTGLSLIIFFQPCLFMHVAKNIRN